MTEEYLSLTPGTIKTSLWHTQALSAIAPRPIGFASTLDKNGTPNLSPYSFFNVFSSRPPVLIFSPARRVRDNTTKHSLQNLFEVPEVVINVVSWSIVQQMNLSSTEYGKGVNEFVKAGFTMLPSETVQPLRVAEAPVQFECKVREIKPLSNEGGAGNLIICEILKMHIRREVLGADGIIDPHKIDLVGRMGKNHYVRASGDAVFEVDKPLRALGIGVDSIPARIRLSQWLSGNDLGRLGNVEAMPSQEEVQSFVSEHPAHFKGIDSLEGLHSKAHELLEQNQNETAWKVLLADELLKLS